jgi:3-methylcrotonyl-CoA carboxylase alpha subunit
MESQKEIQVRPMRRLLVANRGEIACRVVRTCQAMGIDTVAVYSDADADAPHVQAADLAVRLGPAPAHQSYLVPELLLEAARASGADAIHPGYGFLSENADFAQAVLDAGLTWVGPHPEAIAQMGSKMRAKMIALEAGVPVVPGYSGDEQSEEVLLARAEMIGYPLLIKASAGGGGKGMRVVRDAAHLRERLAAARREAISGFGDGALVLERYLERPRHVEFQILGDKHGNLLHLHERECSIQRRYQKIIEEAPSVALSPELRSKMGAAAVQMGRALGYDNAGTVEFILDDRGAFYFLEVNTRLQVEHPITEEITGVDLVRQQLRVAQGYALDMDQDKIPRRGAAVECRLYAEDTAAGFLPSTGRMSAWSVPQIEGLRVDTGVQAGGEVSVHYDPMLAKLITWAPTRAEATQKMIGALKRTRVHGVRTNRQFLIDTLSHPRYEAGDLHTHFVQEHMQAAMQASPSEALLRRAAQAAVVAGWLERQRRRAHLPQVASGFRNNFYEAPRVSMVHGDRRLEVGYRALGAGRVSLLLDGQEEVWTGCSWQGGQLMWTEQATGLRRRAWLEADGGRWYYQGLDGEVGLKQEPRFQEPGAELPQGACAAPMPGKVLELRVEPGHPVEAGQVLLILEAMKMEHPVQAPQAGVIQEVLVQVGQQVEVDTPLVVLQPAEETGAQETP